MRRRPLIALAALIVWGCAGFRSSLPSVSREITYSFAIPVAPDSVSVQVYIPPSAPLINSVVLFVARSVEQYAFDDRDWRAMCGRADCALARVFLAGAGTPQYEPAIIRRSDAGGGDAILRALGAAADLTRRQELRSAKLVMFGHSAAGSFVVSFASQFPEKVLGVIRYHPVPVVGPIDSTKLAQINTLTIVGERDTQVDNADSRRLWQAMRTRNAPWAFVSHVNQPHASVDGLIEAGSLMRDWVESTIRRDRLDEGGWLFAESGGEFAPEAQFRGPKTAASWVPDVSSAIGLRRLAGVCSALGLEQASQVLGSPSRLVGGSVYNCRYTTIDSADKRDLVLALTPQENEADAHAMISAPSPRASVPVGDVGDEAIFTSFELRGTACGSLLARRQRFVATVSLCGRGFGAASDTLRLKPIATGVVGVK